MNELKLYYEVTSGGDGSAGISFVSSEEFAEWLQNHNISNENEWAEPCIGTIIIKSESPMTANITIETPERLYADLEYDIKKYGDDDGRFESLKEFMKEYNIEPCKHKFGKDKPWESTDRDYYKGYDKSTSYYISNTCILCSYKKHKTLKTIYYDIPKDKRSSNES